MAAITASSVKDLRSEVMSLPTRPQAVSCGRTR
jgi:hypothetical protein